MKVASLKRLTCIKDALGFGLSVSRATVLTPAAAALHWGETAPPETSPSTPRQASTWIDTCLECFPLAVPPALPGFPGGSAVKNPPANAGDDPWFGKIPWRRKWQPTPVSLPEKSHGQRSLVDCSPWIPKELDTIEQLTLSRDLVTTQVWIILSSNTWFT